MKYRIVGADGKTYGPVGLEEIRRWLTEGRAESRTPVYADGAAAWTTLRLLPELAAHFAGAPPAINAPQPASGRRRTNGFATASLICALLSWTCCCCLPFNLLAIAFAIVALVQISSQTEPQEGRIFAIIALVLAVVNLLAGLGLGLLQLLLNPNTLNIQTGQF